MGLEQIKRIELQTVYILEDRRNGILNFALKTWIKSPKAASSPSLNQQLTKFINLTMLTVDNY